MNKKRKKHSVSQTRSSHQEEFSEKDGFKNFIKFTGKQLCWSLFLTKKIPATLSKSDSNTGVLLRILRNFL